MSGMMQVATLPLPGFEYAHRVALPDDWTFSGASTRELTHCYHDYPARMIPQIARKLLDMFAADATLMFDPYCGTGTSLVEAMIRGINVVGTDLNPLARLIARTKTTILNVQKVDEQIANFHRFVHSLSLASNGKPIVISYPTQIRGITRLNFWFKTDVIEKLTKLKAFIGGIDDDAVRSFFQVAFSETVRESSNTRKKEFKLYRYSAARLEKHTPDVCGIMGAKLQRNRAGLRKFLAVMCRHNPPPTTTIYKFNTVLALPRDKVAPSSVDIVVTSPPYGDSHTTVAYGQYSRLSAAWLGLSEPDKVDRKLMGGVISKNVRDFPCDELNKALGLIKQRDIKRAREVSAFYSDLYNSVTHVAQAIRPDGYACYVVGNRKVKGVVLPTDVAIRCFFEHRGFEHVDTFRRTIPNKRMPSRNSPTNAIGAVEATMTREYIVVMRKK